MKRAERSRQWGQYISGWKASRLTQSAYCEREGISYDTFKRLAVSAAQRCRDARFSAAVGAGASGSVACAAVDTDRAEDADGPGGAEPRRGDSALERPSACAGARA